MKEMHYTSKVGHNSKMKGITVENKGQHNTIIKWDPLQTNGGTNRKHRTATRKQKGAQKKNEGDHSRTQRRTQYENEWDTLETNGEPNRKHRQAH